MRSGCPAAPVSSHARLKVLSRISCACARSGMRLTQYEKNSSACSSKMSRNSCSFHRLRIAGESYDSRFWQKCDNFPDNFHSALLYVHNCGVDNSNPETEGFVNVVRLSQHGCVLCSPGRIRRSEEHTSELQ